MTIRQFTKMSKHNSQKWIHITKTDTHMKNYPRIVLFFVFGLCALNYTGFSQGKFEVSGGYGWPDLISLRIKYGQKVQVGGGVGFLKIGDNEALGLTFNDNTFNGKISVDVYYHFAGKSKYFNIKPWYLNSGLCYLWSNDLNKNPKKSGPGNHDQRIINIYLRIGRDVNLSKKYGLSIDVGPAILWDYNFYDHKYSFAPIILPAYSINLFIRP